MSKSCPTCGKPENQTFRPFCSKRCADLDLGNWLDERYRIPSRETPSDADSEADE